jgi:hypothetical protein
VTDPRFARDAKGRLRAARGALDPLLADFLATDVGEGRGRIAEIEDAAQAVAEGRLQGWETTGNLYILSLDPWEAAVESMFDETRRTALPLAEFRALLAAWAAASAPPRRDPSTTS